MPDFHKNLWAPWRMEYIRSLHEEQEEGGCFLCRYWSTPESDTANHVVWRMNSAFVVMNRFPYTNGHLLVAHAEHKGEFSDLGEAALAEMTRGLRDAVEVLRSVCQAQGFNVGYNVGQCAGAGLPGHLHAHVVPRWSGDTNFMTVVGDARVLSDSLDASFVELRREAARRGLARG